MYSRGVILQRLYILFFMILLPFIADAATCPDDFSENDLPQNSTVVPVSEQCPDGYASAYTVLDCSDPNAGGVCATCESGYLLGGTKCVQTCKSDKTKIHFGEDLSFNLLNERGTTPALNIQVADNRVCYVDLVSGTGRGLNFELPDGTQYHAVSNSGGYRVCVPEYELKYSCGSVGGTPPEPQKMLDGQWFTLVPGFGDCRVPDGYRFDGWYLNDTKYDVLRIHEYDFNDDVSLVAKFKEAIKYPVSYYCAPEDTEPVCTVMLEETNNIGFGTPCDMSGCALSEGQTLIALYSPVSDAEVAAMLRKCPSCEGIWAMAEGVLNGTAPVTEGSLEHMMAFAIVMGDGGTGEFGELQAISDLLSGHVVVYADYENYEGITINGNPPNVVGTLALEDATNVYPVFANNTRFNVEYICPAGTHATGGFSGRTSVATGEEAWIGASCVNDFGNTGYAGGVAKQIGWCDGTTICNKWNYIGMDKTLFDYERDVTFVGLYEVILDTITFNCGANGVLTDENSANYYLVKAAVSVDTPLTMTFEAECTPTDAGKRFVGWKLPDDYGIYDDRLSVVYQIGDSVDWWYIIAAMDALELDKTVNFEPVYEDMGQ